MIMSDWMCMCVCAGGLYSGCNIWHLGSFESHAAERNILYVSFFLFVFLSVCLSFFFVVLSFVLFVFTGLQHNTASAVCVRERERERERERIGG